MHETAIAKQILEEVKKKAGGKKIKSITIEVGDLGHLPAKELWKVMDKLVKFEVFVKRKKARVKCMCGYEGEPHIMAHEHDFVLFECPNCEKVPRVLEGSDIVLKSIETE